MTNMLSKTISNKRRSWLIGFVFLCTVLVGNSFLFVSPGYAVGLGDLFGAIIPPGAQPGEYFGGTTVPATPVPYSTGAPGPSLSPPLGTPSPGAPPTGNYIPIVVSGLTFYPQCSSSAIPNASWSGNSMPGCGTFCSQGCAISSAAMIFSSLSGETRNPQEFINLYVPQYFSSCLISYTDLSDLFEAHNIDTQPARVFPSPLGLHSTQGSAIIDGYLQSGQTMLVAGTVNGYTHWVWIVGKENGHYLVMDPYWSAPPAGTSPTFPIIPYTSERYTSFTFRSLLPVRQRI
jgi:hypothetical protein